MFPPQVARQLATLDRMLGGRLTINVISSDLPGARECMRILRALLDGKPVSHHGELYDLELEPPAGRAAAAADSVRGFGTLIE